jgi:glycerophosphoryl diester phosphodiesterase
VPETLRDPRWNPPWVVAHRGASALRPEHTLAAYARAIADGADFIEPDLVATRDGVLVARHENEIGGTTDVAQRPQFAARRTSREIDGRTVEGWFTEDFTLAELKTLRARERLPELRGTAFDGQFEVPTLDEITALLAAETAARGRTIGLMPELKHSTYFRARGLPLEAGLLAAIEAHAVLRAAPVVVQSFEVGNLRWLHARLAGRGNVRLLQLVGSAQAHPFDVEGSAASYAQMLQPAGLEAIARYAQCIGVRPDAVRLPGADGAPGAPTSLVADAHAAGLQVLVYTFRPENKYLPRAWWEGEDPRTRHPDAAIALVRAYLEAGVDGVFADDPALARAAVDAWRREGEAALR